MLTFSVFCVAYSGPCIYVDQCFLRGEHSLNTQQSLMMSLNSETLRLPSSRLQQTLHRPKFAAQTCQESHQRATAAAEKEGNQALLESLQLFAAELFSYELYTTQN